MVSQVTTTPDSRLLIESTFLSYADVAKLLRRSEASVRQMTHRRQIPFRRIGRRVVFIHSEILQMVDSAPGIRLEEIKQRMAQAGESK